MVKTKIAYEGDEGEGWETGREKKFIELICRLEFCPLFIETVRQLKERMLQGSARQGNPGECEYMGVGKTV